MSKIIFHITVLEAIKEWNAVFTLPNAYLGQFILMLNVYLSILPREKRKRVLIAFRLLSEEVCYVLLT